MRTHLTHFAVAILGVAAFADYEGLQATGTGQWSLGTTQNFVTAQDSTVYDNITTFTGYGASAVGSALVGTVMTSRVLADDITCVAGGGQSMSTVTWYTVNFNAVAKSLRMRIRFWADDGVGGAPGTLLGGVSFSPASLDAYSINGWFFNFYASSIFINIPVNKKLWYGMLFDNSGGSPMTDAEMNDIGLAMFNPPTVGSSADRHWVSNVAGSHFVNNPAGMVFDSPFGGVQVANYGLQIMVPEPSTYAAVATGLLGLLGLRRRK